MLMLLGDDEFIHLLALCSCDAWFNQNSYVDNFIINLLKIK